ncbi:MAG: NAD(P)H-dependent glycerol-3-phosphate dehydrogenase [Bacteroidales bacterium]
MKHGKTDAAVLGGGSWGTALVKVLQHNGVAVGWWVRREAQKQHILAEHHNPDYLSYTEIDTSNLHISTDIAEVVRNARVIILAIPSAFLHEATESLTSDIFRDKTVISAVKGIEPVTLLPVYQWLQTRFDVPEQRLGVIGGPCHSEEVAMQRLSYLTLGVYDENTGREVADLIRTPWLPVRISEDVPGISMASVLKNVYGILCGIANGLRYGDNFQSVLVTNAIMEMEQVLLEISGNNRRINQSVYAGDLMVTAYSRFSRNWMFGNLVGKGYSVKSALLELKMVAEGYYAAASLAHLPGITLSRYPLLNAVWSILYQNIPAAGAMAGVASNLE